MSQFWWVATAALDGTVLADLPELDVGKAKQVIGRYEPATAKLPFEKAPEDWERIVTPGASVFHLLRENPDDPSHGIPMWAGMLFEDALTEADDVEFPLATVEAYFDRRYVGNKTYTGVGQNLIVKDLVETYAAAGSNGGLPIRVQIVNGGAGALRDRKYLDQDDKTLYSVLTDLMGVVGGPEWTVGWEWRSNPERITPVLYVGDRLGSAATPGLGPAAVFEMPASVTKFRRFRSYAAGKGANDVMAVSSGQGDERPQSEHIVTPDVLRPTFEHRFTPSTSITEAATLSAYALAAAPALHGGTITLEWESSAGEGPQLGVDWFIGDDVGWKIDPGRVPAFPHGYDGVARAIGWEIALDQTPRVVPILAGGDV